MRVVYAGDFSQPWHTESYVAREIETLGHHVDRWHGGPMGHLTDLCDGAHLLVLQANGGLPATGGSFLRAIESAGTVTASYHLDLYRGLGRGRRVDTDIMWRTQHVFTADGDPAAQAWFRSKCVNHSWLPAACATAACVSGACRDDYDYDVVFVGAEHYHREWPWRRTLIGRLRSAYGARFRLFDHHPPTRGLDLNDLYATARVVVGDSLMLDGSSGYWSDRYYETVGRGGFLVAPDVPGIRAHFTHGEHLCLVEPQNWEHMRSAIDYYLTHQDEAREIAAKGQAHVRANHTYRHRAEKMFATVGLAR